MEVILLKKCRYGNIGDIITVKNGFARNKLIPCGEAQRATEENKKDFEKRRAELEANNQTLLLAAEETKKQLSDATISLTREASRDMKLYGAISKRDIADALKEKYDVLIELDSIVIPNRIKEVGVHDDIIINLHHDVIVKVELNVLAREDN